MAVKRFILKENGVIDDTQLNILLDGGEDKEDMVDLLNDLNDENEHYKSSKRYDKGVFKMTAKRFRYDNGVWDNNVEDMADALLTEKECCDLLNKYDVGYNQCRKDVLRLEEDLDYYKTKCASLETGLIQSDREIKQLKQGLTEMIGIIDRKIKNNDCNPSQDFRVYSAVNKALKNLKADLRSCMEEHYG